METSSYKEETDNAVKGFKDDICQYINLKIDECKLRGVEGMAALTSRAIFIVLATMLGGVILQLAGISAALLVAQLVGNMALGFAIVALFFIIVLAVLFSKRKSLFMNRLVKMYIDLFFKD